MNVEILERREVDAEPAEMRVLPPEEPQPDFGVTTQYYEIRFRPLPLPYRGRTVVSQLPADWPYPPEEGY